MNKFSLLIFALALGTAEAFAGGTSHDPACNGMSHLQRPSIVSSNDGSIDLQLGIVRGLDGCYSLTKHTLTLKIQAFVKNGAALPQVDAKVTSLDAEGNILRVSTIPSVFYTWDRSFFDAAKLVVEIDGFPMKELLVEPLLNE